MSDTDFMDFMKDKVSPYYADFTNVLFDTANTAVMELKNSGSKLSTTSPVLDYLFTSLNKDNEMYMDIDENLPIQGPIRKFTQILRPTGLAAFDRNEELTVHLNNTIATMVVYRGIYEDGFRVPADKLFNMNQLKKTDCNLYLVLAPYPESVSPPKLSIPKCNRSTSVRSRLHTLNCQDNCKLRYVKSESRDVIDCSYTASFWLVDVNHRSDHLYNMVTQQCIFAGPRHMYAKQARELAYIKIGRVDKLVTLDTKIPKYKCSGRDVYELKPFLFNPDPEWTPKKYYIPSASEDVGGSVVLDPAKLLRSGTKPGYDSDRDDDSDDSSVKGGGSSGLSRKRRKTSSSTATSKRFRFTGSGVSGHRPSPSASSLSAGGLISSISGGIGGAGTSSRFIPPSAFVSSSAAGAGGVYSGSYGASGGTGYSYGSGPVPSSRSVFSGFGERLADITTSSGSDSAGSGSSASKTSKNTPVVVKESPVTQKHYGIITTSEFTPASATMVSGGVSNEGRNHLQRRNELLNDIVERYNYNLEANNARLKTNIADRNDELRREMKSMSDATLLELVAKINRRLKNWTKLAMTFKETWLPYRRSI
jgi:hypothetical protein